MKTDSRDNAQVTKLDAEELQQLAAVFGAPRWLRHLGRTSWLLVGVAAILVGLTWALGIASSIVGPVLIALVLATITTPIVDGLERKHVPRAVGALIVLLSLIVIVVIVGLLVVQGIATHSGDIGTQAKAALTHLQSWLESLGVGKTGASKTTSNIQTSVPDLLSTFTKGLAAGISGIASIGFFLSFSAFCTFFSLKDATKMRTWFEHHLGVPVPVAQVITREVGGSLRRYFVGTTIVGGFNAVVIGIGAVVLDVPLAMTIAVVTLVTSYIPFIGAVVSGAFAVVMALGSQGTTTALIMLVIVLLANGLLQNLVMPVAMGATLQLSPLLILIVTVAAGCFFGMTGMVLAAPLTASGLHIATRVRLMTPQGAPPYDTPADSTAALIDG